MPPLTRCLDVLHHMTRVLLREIASLSGSSSKTTYPARSRGWYRTLSVIEENGVPHKRSALPVTSYLFGWSYLVYVKFTPCVCHTLRVFYHRVHTLSVGTMSRFSHTKTLRNLALADRGCSLDRLVRLGLLSLRGLLGLGWPGRVPSVDILYRPQRPECLEFLPRVLISDSNCLPSCVSHLRV